MPGLSPPQGDARINRLEHVSPSDYIEFYARIGGPWHWRDRLAWTDSEIATYLGSPHVRLYALEVNGENAGYFELTSQDDGAVEITYFGLDRRFIGRGLGGWA